MKILQISHGLPPKENAGVELYTYFLSKALLGLNHEIIIFCREADPEREEFSTTEEFYKGLKVIRVVNNLSRISDSKIYYDNHYFDEIFLKLLEREKPDLVHFQHFIALSAHLLRLAKERGIPVVITLHDFFILCHRIHLLKEDNTLCPGPLYGLECMSCLNGFYSSKPKDRRTAFFLRNKDILPFPFIKWTKRFFIPSKFLENKGYEVFHRYRFMYEILKISDLILTPSAFVQKQFLKYYPRIKKKLRLLPLGIPPIQGKSMKKRENGKVHFCYYGNILPLKGLHILVEAFKTLPKEKTALVIYGRRSPWNEAYYDQLKEQAKGFPVDFRDAFQREDLTRALKDQDVLVLPSICPESFSFVAREANGLGLPIIASRIGAIPEVVEDGKNGFLFEPGDIIGLRNCMLKFIENTDLIRRMAGRMPKPKTMEEHARELEEIYRRLIEEGR